MRFLVLGNPMAGRGEALRSLSVITRMFAVASRAVNGLIVPSVDEMRAEIRGARRSGFDALILMGGDGTVHEALPAILDADLPFGIIPCGRGNDFARNLGIGSRDWQHWDLRAEPILREIDLPSINGVPFVSIACAGFDATVNRLARDRKGLMQGRLGYAVCVLRALRAVRAFPASVRAGDAEWSGCVLMIAVANGPCYGGGMRIAPGAEMDDGRLDVCVIEEVPKRVLLSQFPKVYRGTHVGHPKVHILTGPVVEIMTDEPQDVYADGEHAGTLPAICTVSRRKVRVISFPRSRTQPAPA
jgi:diacylglycerol kinase (ATP)